MNCRMPCERLLLMLLIALNASVVARAADIPLFAGESLAGQRVRLPSDIVQRNAVLIVGFSQTAAGQAEKWGTEVSQFRVCGGGQTVEWYEMPVLSGIPRLIRPLVIRSMKSELEPAFRSHFLPIYSDEGAWKAALGFSVSDDAYVAIVTRGGAVSFRMHGAVDPTRSKKLRDELQAGCASP